MMAHGLDSITYVPQAHPVLRRLADEVGSDFAMVSLIWATESVLLAGVGMPLGRVDRASGICSHALADPTKPLMIPDTRYDPRTMDSPFVLGPPFVRSYLGLAFGCEPALPVGVVFVAGRAPRRFSPRDVAAVRSTTAHVLSLLLQERPRGRMQ